MQWILGWMLVGAGAGEVPLATRLDLVTVFPSSALVQRFAEVPAGGGTFVVSGLPHELDPATVRARAIGAALVGIETVERRVEAASSERVEALRREWRAAGDRLAELVDRRDVAQRREAHVAGLLALEEEARLAELRGGGVNMPRWRADLAQFTTAIGAARRERRELGWQCEEAEAELAAAAQRLGEQGADVRLQREVRIELPEGAPAARIELEYVVPGAGWSPAYDLRAARDARSVELGYRAQVWQTTGEDWNEVELALSTARPQVGAQGPDPRGRWLAIDDRAKAESLRALGYDGSGAVSKKMESQDFELEVAQGAAAPPRVQAEVERQGLSVRLRIARRESVLSGGSPANVLIGTARLDVTPEYFAAPELDSSVWLRGRARNTSEWTLLPGSAAVYFDSDYLGSSSLALVQPGAELTLHLGPDPALTVERALIEDLSEGPSVFGKDTTRTQRWRVRLRNSGAAAADPDGGATVFVREALPRSTDERIVVKPLEARPAPSKDERWKADREERGLLVWSVRIPRGGEALVEHGWRVSAPSWMEVTR